MHNRTYLLSSRFFFNFSISLTTFDFRDLDTENKNKTCSSYYSAKEVICSKQAGDTNLVLSPWVRQEQQGEERAAWGQRGEEKAAWEQRAEEEAEPRP